MKTFTAAYDLIKRRLLLTYAQKYFKLKCKHRSGGDFRLWSPGGSEYPPVNILRQAVKLTGEREAVIGGMHLGESSPETIAATAGYLKETGVALVAPLHCTGPEAVFTCRNILGQRLKPAGAGTVFEF